GGARCGYVNPDEVTIDYLRGREFAPNGEAFERAARWWREMASDADARYADRVELDSNRLAPSGPWRINPAPRLPPHQPLPHLADPPDEEGPSAEEAYRYMMLRPGAPLVGTAVDVCFIGSCTNGRISDLREAARVARTGKVRPGVRALVVPGSQAVQRQAEQ